MIVQELRQTYLIDDLLNVSHLPRSTFYYHLKQLSRPEQDTVIKDKIQNIYHTHKGRYEPSRDCRRPKTLRQYSYEKQTIPNRS